MSQPSSCRLDAAESKVQRNFQQGSDDESSILSRKADPTTILNLAEQRMQSLLDKFAADKTVRLRRAQYSSCGLFRACPAQLLAEGRHERLRRARANEKLRGLRCMQELSEQWTPRTAKDCWSFAGSGGLCPGASRRQSHCSHPALPQARRSSHDDMESDWRSPDPWSNACCAPQGKQGETFSPMNSGFRSSF